MDPEDARSALRRAVSEALEQSLKPYHEPIAPAARPSSLDDALEALAGADVVPEDVVLPAGERDLLSQAERVHASGIAPSASPPTAVSTVHFAFNAKLPYEALLPRLREMQRRLHSLSPAHKHVGLDNRFDRTFMDNRHRGPGSVSGGAHEFCLQGCPPAVRLSAWCAALDDEDCTGSSEQHGKSGNLPGLPDEDTAATVFDAAVKACGNGSPCDGVASAMARRVSESTEYFVFAAPARAVLTVLCRDGTVRFDDDNVLPSLESECERDILPCKHLGLLLAPLLYLSNSTSTVLSLFKRLLRSRLWTLCTLSTVCENGMLPLLRAVDDMLQERDPVLAMHLRKVGMPAHRAASTWVITAFASALPAREVLLLWDRMIGSRSNLVISLLAASLLHFRRSKLLRCGDGQAVLAHLEDVNECKVVPLMQSFLFPEE